MKILLTSTGLEGQIGDFFIKLLAKPTADFNLAFIPTAADPYQDKWFMQKDLEVLTALGFNINIVDLKKDPALVKMDLVNSQIIYFGGGNTFYLLDWVRKSGVDKYLKDLLNQNHYYVGASAGSILAGPDIAISGWDPSWDSNDVRLNDTTGLAIVPFAISPHFTEKERPVLENHKTDYQVIPITDNQAVYWNDGFWQIIPKP